MSIHSITNFKILTNAPIDDRMLFPSYDALINTFEEHPAWLYEGLITYIIDTKSIMVFKGDEWVTYESASEITVSDPLYRDNNNIELSIDDNTLFVDENGKLSTRFEDHFIGWFNASEDLPIIGDEGQYAVVVSTGTFWVWDNSTSIWVDSETVGTGVISVVTKNGGIESGIVEITTEKIGALPDTTIVGDMKASIYDTDYDGIVDVAKISEKIYGIDNARPNQYYGKNIYGVIGFHNINGGSSGGINCEEAIECIRSAASTVAFTGNYNDLINRPYIPLELRELIDDPYHQLITENERDYWNSKQDPINIDVNLIENKSNKGIPGGYVPLNDNGTIPSTFISQSLTSEYMKVSKYDNDLDGSVNYADKILGIDEIINDSFYGVVNGLPGFYKFADEGIHLSTKWGSILGDINDQIDLIHLLDDYVPKTRVIYVKAPNGSYVPHVLSSDVYIDVPTQLSQLTIDNEHTTVTHEQINYWNNKQEYIGYPIELVEIKSNKGIPFGYAPLDSTGKIPSDNLPNLQINNVHTGDCTDIGDVTNPETSDIYICTDEDKAFIYDGEDWVELSGSLINFGGVTAVDLPSGQQTGPIVYITKDNLNLSNLTNDLQMVATTGVQLDTVPVWADEGRTLKQGYTVVHSVGNGDPTRIVSEQGLISLFDSFGSEYIKFVNGKTGESITIDKNDIGLSNVVNELQMFATEGMTPNTIPVWQNNGTRLTEGYSVTNSISVIGTDSKLVTDKAVRDALNEFSTGGPIGTVKSVNAVLPGIDGDVYINKVNIGLGSVIDELQMVATTNVEPDTVPVWADNGRTLKQGYSVTDVISDNPLSSKLVNEIAIRTALTNIKIDVDDVFSTVSLNPVQNKVITDALYTKVDKVYGKGLSTNDLTNTLYNKLIGIEDGANKNIQVDWNDIDESSDAFIQNKPGIVNNLSYGFAPQYSLDDVGKFLKVGNSTVEWSTFTIDADNILYSPDNTTLISTNVQDAIDELWSTKITDYLPRSYAWVGNEDSHAVPQLVATLPDWIPGKYLKTTTDLGILEFATLEIVEYPWYLRNDGGNKPTSNISWDDHKITNLRYATATTDAANLQNVRDEINGFYWKAPVSEINDNPEITLPYALIAHTDGTIHQYLDGWTQLYEAREGSVIYDKSTQKMYFWNNISWQQIIGTGGVSNAVLADGTITLTDNWNINDDIHNYTLNGIPDPVNSDDVANKNYILNNLLNRSFNNPVVMIETNDNNFNESIASIGARYIRYPDGDIREKIYDNEWKTITPQNGSVVYNSEDNRLYVYTSNIWVRIEEIFDGSVFDLSTVEMDHSIASNRENLDAHPQYILKSGDVVTGNINLSNIARLQNMPFAIQDGDGVNFSQLKAYANGAVWQAPVKGIFNTPPSNPEQTGRIIIGPDPTGVFIGNQHKIAEYTLPSGPWTFITPLKGWSVLCQSLGELNNPNDQFSFNGSGWSLFFTGQSHDQLVGSTESIVHTRYLRSDDSDIAEGLITFNPSGSNVPFIVPETKNAIITNLNSNLLNGYTQNVDATSNSIALRTSNGSLNVNNLLCNGYINSLSNTLRDPVTSATIYSDNIKIEYNIHDHYLRFVPSSNAHASFVTFNYDAITTNAGEVLTTSSYIDADLLNGHNSSYFIPASAKLKNIVDVSDIEPLPNQVLAYDSVNDKWTPVNGPSISSSNHDALIGLHYKNDNVISGISDDHPQYINSLRYVDLHDKTSAHALGNIVPHDELNGLTNVNINNPQEDHLLVYRDGTWINAYANAFMFTHDSMNTVNESTGHKRYLHIGDKNDPAPNKILSNLSIGNIVSENYVPFTGSSVYNYNDFRNMSINLGQFTTLTGYTNGTWYKDTFYNKIYYSGSTGFKIKVISGYNNGFSGLYHTLAFGKELDELQGHNGFIVKIDDNTLLNAYDDINVFNYRGYKVWHEGCNRDHSHGGALSGLNADTLWGLTPSELMSGGTVIHANILNNVVNQANNGISDDHSQYLTFGFATGGFTSSNKHANTSLHTIGTVVPKPKFDTEIDGILISNKGVGDFISWNGTNWINAPVNHNNINHDNIATDDSSAHDNRYIRKNATQVINNWLKFDGIDTDPHPTNKYVVPFTLEQRDDWQTVQHLSADKLDGWDANDFAFKAVDQTISGNNTFTGKVDITSNIRIPKKSSTYIPEEEREIYLNQDNGFLYYTWKNASNQVMNIQLPVSSISGGSNISGTTSTSFFIGDINGLYLRNESNELVVRDYVGALTSIKGKDIYVGSSSGNPVKITDTSGDTPKLDNLIISGGELVW